MSKSVGVMVRRSKFGGGWAWSVDATGAQVLWQFFGEGPAAIPIGDCEGSGYIIEPDQTDNLAEYLRTAGVAWELG